MPGERKRRVVTWFHRTLANPVMRRLGLFLPGQALLETVGRNSGQPRQVPVGGRLDGDTFWLVSNHGQRANYVRNIKADPQVRLRIRNRWRGGVAHLLPGDDPRARLRQLPAYNSAMVRLLGTNLLTVRIDLDQPGATMQTAKRSEEEAGNQTQPGDDADREAV